MSARPVFLVALGFVLMFAFWPLPETVAAGFAVFSAGVVVD